MTDSYSNIQGELYTTFFGKYDSKTTIEGILKACTENNLEDLKYYLRYGKSLSRQTLTGCLISRPSLEIAQYLYLTVFDSDLKQHSIDDIHFSRLIQYSFAYPFAIKYICELCEYDDYLLHTLSSNYDYIKNYKIVINLLILQGGVTYQQVCEISKYNPPIKSTILPICNCSDVINVEQWIYINEHKDTVISRPPTFKAAFKKEILKIMTPRLIYILPKDLVGDICKYV